MRRWALAVFVALLVVSAFFAVRHVVSARDADQALLATQGGAVSLSVAAMVRDAGNQASAVAALFRASEEVTDLEFVRFVEDIGLTDGFIGLGYITRVEAAHLEAFQAAMQIDHPEAFVFEVEGVDPVPVAARDVYYPIKYFYSRDQLPAWGFDTTTSEEFAAAIERMTLTEEPTATRLFTFPGWPDMDGWAMFEPAFDGSGALQGFVAGAIDLSDVLAAAAPMGVGERVDLRIVDLSSGVVPPPPEHAWSDTIFAVDRVWRLDVTPRSMSSHLWGGLGIFGLGVVTSAALAFVVLGFGARLQHRREIDEFHSLNRQKDDFLATVSHELRTPLTSIIGFADALREGDGSFTGPEKGEMIDFIADEADAMEGIVQDLLVVARLQQGGKVPIACALVSDLAGEVGRIAEQSAIVRSSPTTVTGNAAVTADAARLRQIVRNLFDNAVRHGRPPIEVRIESDGEWVQLVVRDSGGGVEPSMVPELFDRYRSGPNPDGLPSSTGIGLWLSRELARLMGGDLRFLGSTGGAAFELSLPVAGGGVCAVPQIETEAVGF
jgi:signal transduction histidine kinase